MVRPSPEFFLLMFALFKAGAVPVLVDPGHRPARAEAVPGRGAAGGLHRHSAGARRARAAGLGDVGAHAHHHRRARLAGRRDAGARSSATAPAPARNWPTRSPTTSPRSCSPAARPACRRAWCTAIAISSRRSRCCAMRSASQPGGVDLPTFPPFALFDPALGLTSIIPDMDPTKPARADPRKLHARDRALRRRPVVRLARADGACWRDHGAAAADGAARDLGRRAGAGRRGREDARAAARRRAVLDAVRRHRMPAGRGDRRPRTAGHARGNRSAAPAPASAARCAPNEVRIIRISDDADRAVVGRPAGRATAWSARSPSPARPPPTATSTAKRRRALAKIREPLPRRQRAHRAPHGRSRLLRWRGPAVVLRAQVAPRRNRAGPAVHRAGRAGVQHASATCAAPRWSASARRARSSRCCASSWPQGVHAREWPRIERELRAHRAGHAHTARIERFRCIRVSGRHPPQRQDRAREAGGVGSAAEL